VIVVVISLSEILYFGYFSGEVVAGIIGLDDSKFQDVIDNMTKEDWMVALEVRVVLFSFLPSLIICSYRLIENEDWKMRSEKL
jgi:hypothetical protein